MKFCAICHDNFRMRYTEEKHESGWGHLCRECYEKSKKRRGC